MFRTFAIPLFTSFFAIFMHFAAGAQNSWNPLTSGVSSHLLGIHFTDENTGYAVGYNGTILKTTDGGDNWSAPLQSQTTDAFYAVFFKDALNGFAVGDNGLIRQTTDGGDNWSVVNSPVNAHFRVVWFLDAQIGFIGGGFPDQDAMLKTTDGGATWNALPATGNFQTIYGIYFTDVNTGYAVDWNGNVLRTFDGGFSWSVQQISNAQLNAITFTNVNTGYTVGRNGVILKTTDAGNSWFAQSSGTSAFLSDVKFLDASTGFIVGGDVPGNNGIILKTSDGGNTWTQENISTGSTSRQYRMFIASANIAFSCGLDGTIFKTTIEEAYCCDDFQNSLFNAAFTYDPATGQFCAPEGVQAMDLLIWNIGDGNTFTWWGSEPCFGYGYSNPGSYLVSLIIERVRPDGKVCQVRLAQLVTIESGSNCDQCAQYLSQIYSNVNVAVDMSYWNGPGSSVVFYPLPTFSPYQVRISWDVNCDGSTDYITYGNDAFEYSFSCGQQVVCYTIECLQSDQNTACSGYAFAKYFSMPCFEQPCSCDDLVCDVNNGFSHSVYYNNQVLFSPNTLTVCDKVTWAWGDGTANISSGNDAIWHTYSAPGTYFVCMIVARTLPDGSTCEMRKYCESVQVSNFLTNPETAQVERLNIFPNPGSGQFIVSLPHEFDDANNTVQISSAEGKVLQELPVESAEMKLNLDALPAGLYLMTLKNAQGQRLGDALRFVKQ